MKKIFFLLLTLLSFYSSFSQNGKIEYRFKSQKPDTIIYIPDRAKDTKASDALNIQAYVHKDSVIFFDKKKFYDYKGFSRRKMLSYKSISFIEGEGRNIVDEQEVLVSSWFAWIEILLSFSIFFFLYFAHIKYKTEGILASIGYFMAFLGLILAFVFNIKTYSYIIYMITVVIILLSFDLLKEKRNFLVTVVTVGGVSFLFHTPVFFIGSITGLLTGYALYKRALKKRSENEEGSDGE